LNRPAARAGNKLPLHLQRAVGLRTTIAATIAGSPIVVLAPVTLLPPGFEEVDLAILNWLAGEAQHMRRSFALMH